MAFKLWSILLLSIFGLPSDSWALERKQSAVGELFTYKIEPFLFNWTQDVINDQFSYRVSLKGYPDLPSWMRYMYSNEHHAGFLYGTPVDSYAGKTFELDIVSLNRRNYETRERKLQIFVAHKFPLTNIIQMKIDNLNLVHLMDPGRVENLKNIFRKELWLESETDLSLIFMESSVNMGGRLPLRPQQREGVIVHLASSAQFSARLRELQEEVRPLSKLLSCTYKRTSVQNIFENSGFKLDWCGFKMQTIEITPEILFHNHGQKLQKGPNDNQKIKERWQAPARSEVPERNYIDEFAFAFSIPGVIFVILVGILSVILCFHHDKLYAEKTVPFSSTVQMVQCSDTNTNPVTTLKSLKDPQCLLDNISQRSQSPHSYHNESPSNTFLRPKPPPYHNNKGGTLGRNAVNI